MQPINKIQRWTRGVKARTKVPQRHDLGAYTDCMSGLGKQYRNIPDMQHQLEVKMWYWPLFTRIIEMAVVNA